MSENLYPRISSAVPGFPLPMESETSHLPEGDGHVVSTESERVAESEPYVRLPRFTGDVVEIAALPGILESGRGRNNPVLQGQSREHGLGGSGTGCTPTSGESILPRDPVAEINPGTPERNLP